MSVPIFSNPQNLPVPLVASINRSKGEKVAITRFRLHDILGTFAGKGPVSKPYLSLTGTEATTKFGITQLSLGNNFPDFGTIRSLGYTFRPNFATAGGDSDYANGNSLYMIQNTSKVIVHDVQTSSTVNIDTDSAPYINSDQGSGIGFYLPSEVIVEGVSPFHGEPYDTIEICIVTPTGATAIGKCELRFYNFEIAPFARTTYSNFEKLA